MDPEAVEKGRAMESDRRFRMHHASFSSMAGVPELRGDEEAEEDRAEEDVGPGTAFEGAAAGVFFDLGISSPQLDGERGFRPEQDAELDMRFDTTRGRPVWRWLRKASREQMAYVFRELGGEDASAAQRIADAVALVRGADGRGVPKRTREFADLVQRAKGGKEYQAMHPAKLAFQALRIHVNREFDELRDGMAAALRLLRGEARMGLITWKHKECSIVIDFFRRHECARPDHPVLQWYEREAKGRGGARLKPRWGLLQEDPIRPTAAELKVNSRARSAVLHLFRKRRALLLPQLEAVAYGILGWPRQEAAGAAEAAEAQGATVPGEEEGAAAAAGRKRRRREAAQAEVGAAAAA
uniref:Uncharacterized protein n=1 Tax=Alexandrium catenella TaxID=2925 RepID=A0A7S1S5C6_ALECA